MSTRTIMKTHEPALDWPWPPLSLSLSLACSFSSFKSTVYVYILHNYKTTHIPTDIDVCDTTEHVDGVSGTIGPANSESAECSLCCCQDSEARMGSGGKQNCLSLHCATDSGLECRFWGTRKPSSLGRVSVPSNSCHNTCKLRQTRKHLAGMHIRHLGLKLVLGFRAVVCIEVPVAIPN